MSKQRRGHKGRAKWPKDKRFGLGKKKVGDNLSNSEREAKEKARAITRANRRSKILDFARTYIGGARLIDEIAEHGGTTW